MNHPFIVKVRKLCNDIKKVTDRDIEELDQLRCELSSEIEKNILNNSEIGFRQLTSNLSELQNEILYTDSKVMFRIKELQSEGKGPYDTQFSNTDKIYLSSIDAISDLLVLLSNYYPQSVVKYPELYNKYTPSRTDAFLKLFSESNQEKVRQNRIYCMISFADFDKFLDAVKSGTHQLSNYGLYLRNEDEGITYDLDKVRGVFEEDFENLRANFDREFREVFTSNLGDPKVLEKYVTDIYYKLKFYRIGVSNDVSCYVEELGYRDEKKDKFLTYARGWGGTLSNHLRGILTDASEQGITLDPNVSLDNYNIDGRYIGNGKVGKSQPISGEQQAEVSADTTKAAVSKATSELDSSLRPYGFFTLPKVAALSIENQQKLIELISENLLPYKVAMLAEIGFIEYLLKKHFTSKKAFYAAFSPLLTPKGNDKTGRGIKGNLSTLSEITTEDLSRYTAYQHKQQVKNDYEGLR